MAALIGLTVQTKAFSSVSGANTSENTGPNSTIICSVGSDKVNSVNEVKTVTATQNITFRVDLGAEVVTGQVWVTGSFNNYQLQVPMRMVRGLWNIWTVTVPITGTPGQSVLYKFVRNSWDDQERITGCNFGTGTNRAFTFPNADTTLGLVCYNKCAPCDSVRVTLNVDMVNGVSVDPAGPHIVGNFQLWSNTSSKMLSAGGTRYSYTRWISKGEYLEYKFLNGTSWGTGEEVVLGPCSYNPQSIPNRWLVTPQRDTTITVAFGSCTMDATYPSPRVGFIGSSGTYGHGSDRPAYQSYPSQFGRFVGAPAVVGNFGRNSTTMSKRNASLPSYWNTVDLKYALSFNPDVLICMLGANDVKDANFKTTLYRADYKSMVDTFRTVAPNVEFYATMPFRTGLATEPLVIDSLNPALRRISADLGISLIDQRTPSFLPGFHLIPDSTHTDSAGYSLIALHAAEMYRMAKPAVTASAESLSTAGGYAAYWWYRNGVLLSPLAGTTNSSILRDPTGGNYKVLVKLNANAEDRLVSPVLAVEALGIRANKSIKGAVSPNPAAGNINFLFNAPSGGDMTIEIYDAVGRMVQSEKFSAVAGTNMAMNDISRLKPGMYTILGRGGRILVESRFVKSE